MLLSGCRGDDVNMITDVVYSVNMYILFCVKCFELSHVMDIVLYIHTHTHTLPTPGVYIC